MKEGVNWITTEEIDSWFARVRDGGITFDEFKELVQGRIGFFARVFNPSTKAMIFDLTKKGWSVCAGDGNETYDSNKDAVQSLDELIERLEKTSLRGAMQGKSVWEMLETRTFVWVPVQDTSRGVKEALTALVIRKINDDYQTGLLGDKNLPQTKVKRDRLIETAKLYIERGEIDKLTGTPQDTPFGQMEGQPANTDLDGKAYDYLNGTADSQLVAVVKGVYSRTKDFKYGDNTTTMYSLVALNALLSTGESLRTHYESRKTMLGIFDPDMYSTLGKISKKIKKLEANVESIEKRLKAEEAKVPPDSKKIEALRKELEATREALKLSRKFYAFACMLCTNQAAKPDNSGAMVGRDDYSSQLDSVLEDEGLEVDPEKVKKEGITTLNDWVHLFRDGNVSEILRKKPPKKEEDEQQATGVTVPATTPETTQPSTPAPASAQPGAAPAPSSPNPANPAPASAAPESPNPAAPANSTAEVRSDSRVTNVLQQRYLREFNIEYQKGNKAGAAEALGNFVMFSVIPTPSKLNVPENVAALANTAIIKRLSEPNIPPVDIAEMVDTLHCQGKPAATQVLLALRAANAVKYEEVISALRANDPTAAAELENRMTANVALACN